MKSSHSLHTHIHQYTFHVSTIPQMTVEYDTGQGNTVSNYTTLNKHVADAVNLKIHLKLYLIV